MSTFRIICNDDLTPAGIVAALLVGEMLTVRVDFGEAGDIALASSPLEAGAAPNGAEVTIDGATVVGFSMPGLYRFKISFATGQWRWLDVFVFESRVLDLVPAAASGSSSAKLRASVASCFVASRRTQLEQTAPSPGALNLEQFGA